MNLGELLNEEAIDLDISGVSEQDLDNIIDEVAGLGRANRARRTFVRKTARAMKSERGGAKVISTSNLTGKAEMEKRFKQLPDDIQQGILQGRLQLTDKALYKITNASGKSTVELMENADTKTIGLTNIDGRKLDADNYFLLLGIQLLSGAYTVTPSDAAFDVPEKQILNGEFSLEVGNKIVIPRMSSAVFNTTGRTDLPKGFYKLDNPKLIKPQTEIVPELRTAAAISASTAVKLVFWGVSIEKN